MVKPDTALASMAGWTRPPLGTRRLRRRSWRARTGAATGARPLSVGSLPCSRLPNRRAAVALAGRSRQIARTMCVCCAPVAHENRPHKRQKSQ